MHINQKNMANSSAAAFFSFAIRWSYVACACPWDCRRAVAKLSFMASLQSLGMEGKAERVN